MSYHEINAVTQYRVHCCDCNFYMIVNSAGAAETMARNHIEEPDKESGLPNFGHTVRISQFTAVGRNV